MNDTVQFKAYDIHTPRLTLQGIETYCRVVDIIDGDSVVIVIPLFGSYYKFNARLDGIDAFEMHSHDPILQQKAIASRNKVFELISKQQGTGDRKQIQKVLNDDVFIAWVKCLNNDKYGRLLCNLYCSQEDEKSISEILIQDGLAYAYGGGTKKTESEQLRLN
jgi:endonuclease YncB( thermonuclease family)